MGESDPETSIGFAGVQDSMETALEDFEKPAAAFRSKNKVEVFP